MGVGSGDYRWREFHPLQPSPLWLIHLVLWVNCREPEAL
jgi:hypothetical protein